MKTFYQIKVNGQTVQTLEQHSEVASNLMEVIRANGLQNVSWCEVIVSKLLQETVIDGVMPTQEQVDEYR